MATATPTPEETPAPDPTPEPLPDPAPAEPAPLPPATVQPKQYAAGTGWEVGDTAPSDAFRALGGDYATPVGPVVYKHPGDYARQIVAKGGQITESVKRELDAADAQPTDESAGA